MLQYTAQVAGKTSTITRPSLTAVYSLAFCHFYLLFLSQAWWKTPCRVLELDFAGYPTRRSRRLLSCFAASLHGDLRDQPANSILRPFLRLNRTARRPVISPVPSCRLPTRIHAVQPLCHLGSGCLSSNMKGMCAVGPHFIFHRLIPDTYPFSCDTTG